MEVFLTRDQYGDARGDEFSNGTCRRRNVDRGVCICLCMNHVMP